MKIWITSDTHFGHDAIVEYCKRPDNHEERIFCGLSRIKNSDCLIHLGDIGFKNDTEIHAKYISPLLCRKVLVIGNHDSKSFTWYMEHGWDFVCHAIRLEYSGKIIMLSHKPQPWDGIWDINVHGHMHNLGHHDGEFKELRKWHRLYSPELMNYEPVELSNFIQKEHL